jgi:hypothetical protein
MLLPKRKLPASRKTLLLLFALLWIAGGEVMAQQATLPSVDSLLHLIEKMQVTEDDFYFKGSFPTYRRYGRSASFKEDNAVFFTGLIAFTLKELLPDLNAAQRAVCDTIIDRAIQSYAHFRNANGLPTFNFWRVRPPLVFPNSWFLNHFNETQQLPDDLDDTVILWLSMDPPDSLMKWVKILMGQHANGETRWIRNTYRRYRKIPAYSTWFGKKMPIDFDFCVLCNVLYFVHEYQLPLNIHDSASVLLLRQMIEHKEYLKHPGYISPHYGRTSLLLYHAARLLAKFSIPALDTLKPQLLQDARQAYSHAGNWLDSVLLSTAIMRLGGEDTPLPRLDNAGLYHNTTTFFVASFSAILPGTWKKILLNNQLIKYYFSCPAYRCALYLENLVLRKSKTLKTPVDRKEELSLPVNE